MILVHAPIIKRGGGPAGWAYQLKSGITETNIRDIKFVTTGAQGLNNKEYQMREFIRKILSTINSSFLVDTLYTLNLNKKIEITSRKMERLFLGVDRNITIHVNDVLSFHAYTSISHNNENVTLFTSHSPTPWYIEMLHSLEWTYKKKYNVCRYKNQLINLEKNAFEHADYIVVPSILSLEAYLQDNNLQEIIYKKIEEKRVLEIPTGIVKPIPLYSREAVREKLSWGNRFVIGYVGRRNRDKGFDIFKKMAKDYSCNKKMLFVSTGRGSIPVQKKDNIIDLGWVEDIYSIINALDLLILPNRYSFFDIAALEALSLGVPILVSDKGGNRLLSKYSKGVFVGKLQNNEIVKDLKDVFNNLCENRDAYSKYNKIAYKKFFTAKRFALRYNKNIRKIIK